MKALIFDCDGVLVDTEKDGHRVAFNRAFSEMGLSVNWDIGLYADLVKVAGGKERMKHFFSTNGWPDGVNDKDSLIIDLHKNKTKLFMEIIENGELSLRPGVARLVDEAIADNIKLAVCSTSNEKAVNLIVSKLLGEERQKHFSKIFAGDIVKNKKPNPEIYQMAISYLNLNPNDCIVVEDSRNGLLAAKGAKLKCVITTNGYTKNEDFSEADLVVSELGDNSSSDITIEKLKILTNTN